MISRRIVAVLALTAPMAAASGHAFAGVPPVSSLLIRDVPVMTTPGEVAQLGESLAAEEERQSLAMLGEGPALQAISFTKLTIRPTKPPAPAPRDSKVSFVEEARPAAGDERRVTPSRPASSRGRG